MRRKRRFGRPLPQKSVELGKEYDVEIEDISRLGQGMARIARVRVIRTQV